MLALCCGLPQRAKPGGTCRLYSPGSRLRGVVPDCRWVIWHAAAAKPKPFAYYAQPSVRNAAQSARSMHTTTVKLAHVRVRNARKPVELCNNGFEPQFNWKEQMALIGHIRRHVLHHPRIAGSVRCHWKAASKAQCAHIARGIFIVVHAPRPSLVCLSPSA